MFDYQNPDSAQTLGEGLEEYYASRDDLVSGRGVSEAAREFFRCHDAAHVVFGCSTTLPNEAMVKMWSFFGTTGGLGLARAYRLPESQEIYQQIGFGDIVRTAFRATTIVPRVLVRCRRMRERWPWAGFERHRGVALAELRDEYGIQILVVDA